MWGRQPVAIASAIRLVLLAGISFGLKLTDTQLVSSMAALEAILGLLVYNAVTTQGTLQDAGLSKERVADVANRTDLTFKVVGTGDGGPIRPLSGSSGPTFRSWIIISLLSYGTLAAAMLMPGCGGANPNLAPQTRIAQEGTNVLQTIRAVSELVDGVQKATPTPEVTIAADKAQAAFNKAADLGEQLAEKLKIYDASVNLIERDKLGKDALGLLTQISGLVESVGEIAKIGNETSRKQIATAMQNVLKVITTIRGMLPKPVVTLLEEVPLAA